MHRFATYAAVLAVIVFAGKAEAVMFADPSAFNVQATLDLDGNGTAGIQPNEDIAIGGALAAVDNTGSFTLLDGSISALSLVFGDVASNIGRTFTASYTDTGPDPDETGTLTFEIVADADNVNTLAPGADVGSTEFTLFYRLLISDDNDSPGGFEDAPGSLLINGTAAGDANSLSTFTFTVQTPPASPPPPAVPLPASVLLLAGGLAGLGLMRRRSGS
ncbi:MAG: VPLPA-CTERM sorting domain-containing protein [Pseudomonadota bacterium]